MDSKELFNWLYAHYKDAEWRGAGVKGEVNYCLRVEKKKLIVLFQSTQSKFDWFCNFLFFPRRVVPYKNMEIEFKVHKGFWRQFDSIRDSLLEEITSSINENKITELYIYGWSLGGRLAMFCKEMVEFHLSGRLPITCVTIGAPRGFCKTGEWEKISSRFENTTRYTNGSDIVPKLPFKWMGLFTPFTHEVEDVHVGEKFSIFRIFKTSTDHLDSSYKENINK